jgi:hypothetical protein
MERGRGVKLMGIIKKESRKKGQQLYSFHIVCGGVVYDDAE